MAAGSRRRQGGRDVVDKPLALSGGMFGVGAAAAWTPSRATALGFLTIARIGIIDTTDGSSLQSTLKLTPGTLAHKDASP